jgi:hypothetical protein
MAGKRAFNRPDLAFAGKERQNATLRVVESIKDRTFDELIDTLVRRRRDWSGRHTGLVVAGPATQPRVRCLAPTARTQI